MKKKLIRKVFCADSFVWLKGKEIPAIITSLPDMSEIKLTLPQYILWLEKASTLLARTIQKNGCILFYQTNRKFNGSIVDKEYHISNIFYKEGYKKVLQKIILRKEPGRIDLYRPSYSTLFCFSKKIGSGSVTPDVIYTGKMVTPCAIGLNACKLAIDFIKRQVNTTTIVDPFCGAGTVLALANQEGFHAIGVDIDKKQVAIARKLTV